VRILSVPETPIVLHERLFFIYKKTCFFEGNCTGNGEGRAFVKSESKFYEKKGFDSMPVLSSYLRKKQQAQETLREKELRAIEDYKRIKSKHRARMLAKFPNKQVFRSTRDAILSRTSERDLRDYWNTHKHLGYIREGKVRSQEYMLSQPIDLSKYKTSENPQKQDSKSRARIIGFRVENRGTGDSQFHTKLHIQYTTKRGIESEVYVCESDFISHHWKKRFGEAVQSFIPIKRACRRAIALAVRADINEMYSHGLENSMANYDVFFSDAALQAFEDFGLLIVGFDANASASRKGVEMTEKVPFLVFDCDSTYFEVRKESLWVSPGQLRKRLRFLNNEDEFITGREAFFLDTCCGSCSTALALLELEENSGKFAVCVDTVITYAADEDAWQNDNILFVENRVEDMDYCYIPPQGVICGHFGAPDCRVHSIARNSYYTNLNETYGKNMGEQLRKWMITRSMACVRNLVDCNSYFHCPFAIENPYGNNRGMFNCGAAFWDVNPDDITLLCTSYCMFDHEGPRKHTEILLGNHPNVKAFSLPSRCTPSTPCVCLAQPGVTRHMKTVRYEDYAYDLNKIHPKGLDQALGRMLAITPKEI